uniref:Mu-like prophage protein gp36 n=1 Tax=Candidatus Kentrum sp. LPFa TaxID=2126335 RepID=A0A450WZZ2_9GAMM|nr:MAG: Mu-like prophage protein gp36 [Candidatus Kentron sp. LPFa]
MAYCTVEDLTLLMSVDTLTQLSNDDAQGEGPDQAVVARAIEHAEETIDGYLRARYELPLQTAPTLVRGFAGAIARHWLYARRPEGEEDLPKAVVRTYQGAMDALRAIRRGEIDIGISETQDAQPAPSRMRVRRSGPRLFGAEVLGRYRG